MQIGIGLPNTVPGTPGTRLLEWSQRAEERGFSALTTIDRVAYPSHDSLTTLAGAAGATRRIGLLSNILLAPAYPPVLLAKSAATVDSLSGGRFTLGMGAGGRADDFEATGRDFGQRGRNFDDALEIMHAAWRGEPVGDSTHAPGPTPVRAGRVPILIGGTSDAAIRRVAQWADGWTMGGGGPDAAAAAVEQVRSTWRAAGRDGEPRLAVLVYFSLGDAEADESRAYLRDYYAFLGDFAETVADSAVRTETAVADAVRAFRDIGFTDVFLNPTTTDLDQVDRLADVVF